MKTSESIKEIAAALASAQGQMANAAKDRTNTFFKSNYADLASVVLAIKKPLADNHLSYFQDTLTDVRGVGVQTLLAHVSGEWFLTEPLFLPVQKADAQGFGAALTYARRYQLSAVTGIASEDDDANAASSKPIESPPALTPQQEGALQVLRAAALNGSDALQTAWKSAGKEIRLALASELQSLKDAAAKTEQPEAA